MRGGEIHDRIANGPEFAARQPDGINPTASKASAQAGPQFLCPRVAACVEPGEPALIEDAVCQIELIAVN